MRRIILGLFAGIGILTVLLIAGIGVAIWRFAPQQQSLPETIVLNTDLNDGLADTPSSDALSDVVFGRKPVLHDFLDALERAGGDARVKGVYVSLGNDTLGLATCQQLRDAISAFRAKGKFAMAFATSFGEFGPGNRPYYLATAFDQIWLQPLGSVGLIGLQTDVPFFRGALDKLGIVPSFAHREEYKTAMNSLTETSMTAAQREETWDLLENSNQQIVDGIAAARKLPPSQVSTLVDAGPFLADEAKHAGLIDRIGYSDVTSSEARRRAGPGAKFVTTKRYLDIAGRPDASGAKIALIYADGLITESDGASGPLIGTTGVTARRLTRAFRQAAADKDVRAILFRIDSPGGSAVASETIWREVAEARAHGKPVIASMGNVAASGGYYIAAPADKIVAEPATITGSIGVLAGKLVIAGLLDKLGVTAQTVGHSGNAGMFSELSDFTPGQQQRLNAFLDAVYTGFKQRVAAGRHMSMDKIEAVAKGRVWTGEEAKQKGLVDELGGYETALRLVKEVAKIKPDEGINLVVFPREKTSFEKLYARLTNTDDEDSGATTTGRIISSVAELMASLTTEISDPGVLRLPPIGEIR
jgi:protease IV